MFTLLETEVIPDRHRQACARHTSQHAEKGHACQTRTMDCHHEIISGSRNFGPVVVVPQAGTQVDQLCALRSCSFWKTFLESTQHTHYKCLPA